jgi:hypothetical protein
MPDYMSGIFLHSGARMKLYKIRYHLERAAIARARLEAGEIRPGGRGPSFEVLAERHEQKAADYLAEGLREYAGRVQTPQARAARAWRRRQRGIDPRTDPAVAGQGRGARNRGKLFGRQLKDSKDLP